MTLASFLLALALYALLLNVLVMPILGRYARIVREQWEKEVRR